MVGLTVVVGFLVVEGLTLEDPCTEVGGLAEDPGLVDEPGFPGGFDTVDAIPPGDADAVGARVESAKRPDSSTAATAESSPHLLRPRMLESHPGADSLRRAIRTILVPLDPGVKRDLRRSEGFIAAPGR